MPSTDPPTRTTLAPPGRVVLRNIVLVVLGVRVALWAIGLLGLAVRDTGWSLDAILGMWSRWDAPHLLRVADIGYEAAGPDPDDEDWLFIVFLPLYPAIVAAVRVVLRDFVASGLLVSAACSVGAGWFLYRLVRLDAGHAEAWRSVLALFLFPTAYFLAAPYSEALFLMLVLASMYAVRTGRWAGGGLAAGLATATRLQAVVVAPVLALEALLAGPRSRVPGRVGLAALSGAGILVYLAINMAVHGDPLFFVDVQRQHWNNEAAWPWEPVSKAVDYVTSGASVSDLDIIMWGRLTGTAFAATLLVAGVRRLRAGDQLYGWLGLVSLLVSSWLISLPRYLLGLYPLFVVLGRLTSRRWLAFALAPPAVALQGWLFWRYSSAAWTF